MKPSLFELDKKCSNNPEGPIFVTFTAISEATQP
jgi:hypothetical protein